MAEILTHSSMKCFRTCRRKYYFKYIQEIGLKSSAKTSLRIGKAVHKGLELFYNGEQSLDFIIEQALTKAAPKSTLGWDQSDVDNQTILEWTVKSMLAGYFKHMDDRAKYQSVRTEYLFQRPVVNPETGGVSRTFSHWGRADGLVQTLDGAWWLREFKTTSQISNKYFDRIQLDTQVTSYIAALQEEFGINISGVIYTVIRKPSIRQTQKETVLEYCERLYKDYLSDDFDPKTGLKRNEFYYQERQFFRSQKDLEEWHFDKWDTAKDILEARKTNRFYRNTAACEEYGGCEFLPLCISGESAMNLYTHERAHQELFDDNEMETNENGCTTYPTAHSVGADTTRSTAPIDSTPLF